MILEQKAKLFSYTSRIAQYLAVISLYSIKIAAKILGHNYQLRPGALILAAPIFFALLLIKLKWEDIQDEKINAVHQQKKTPLRPKKTTKQLLSTEKKLYLFVSFISDILISFELLSILTSSIITVNIFYMYSALFPISIVYALYIHFMHRYEDVSNRYQKIHRIDQNNNHPLDFSRILIPLSTITCFIIALNFQSIPLLSLAFLITGIYLSFRYLKKNFNLLYSFYLFESSLQSLTHVSRLLVHELRRLSLHIPAARYANIIIKTFSFLYAIIYFASTSRDDYITEVHSGLTPQKQRPISPDILFSPQELLSTIARSFTPDPNDEQLDDPSP